MTSEEELKAKIAALEAENAALKTRGAGKSLYLKVSEKGGVSLYGVGRFPVTLYQEQWGKVLDFGDEIRKFIQDNKGQLKTKE
jgi:hypothetical protein